MNKPEQLRKPIQPLESDQDIDKPLDISVPENPHTPDFGKKTNLPDNKVTLSEGEVAQLIDSVEVPATLLEEPGALETIRKRYVENNPVLGSALAMALAVNGLMPHKIEQAPGSEQAVDIQDILGIDGMLDSGTYDLRVDSDSITIHIKPEAFPTERVIPGKYIEVVVPARTLDISEYDGAKWVGVHGERKVELLVDEQLIAQRAQEQVDAALAGAYVAELTPNDIITSVHNASADSPGFVGRSSKEGPDRINQPASEKRAGKAMASYVDAFVGHGIDATKIEVTSGGMSSDTAPTIESFQADLESRGIIVKDIIRIIQDCNRGREKNPEVLAAFETFASGRGVFVDIALDTKPITILTPALDDSITVQDYAIAKPIAEPQPEPVVPPVTGSFTLRQMRYIPGTGRLPQSFVEPGRPMSRDPKVQQKAVGLSNARQTSFGRGPIKSAPERADTRRRPGTKGAGGGRTTNSYRNKGK